MRCQARPWFDFGISVLLLKKINAMSSSESIRREGSISSATPEVVLAPTQSLHFSTQPQHCHCHLKLPRAPASPSPQWGRWKPCLSSSGISQCRHKTPTRNDHTKQQERPRTTNPSVQWAGQPQALRTGRDRARVRPSQPVCCPCPTPHHGTTAHHGPSKTWKDCPVLGLLIAKLFGRKRRV